MTSNSMPFSFEPHESENSATAEKRFSLRIPSSLYDKLEERRGRDGSVRDMSSFIRKLLAGVVEAEEVSETQTGLAQINSKLDHLNSHFANAAEREIQFRNEIGQLRKELESSKEQAEKRSSQTDSLLEFLYFEIHEVLIPIYTLCDYMFFMADNHKRYEPGVEPEINRLKQYFVNRLRERKGEAPLPEKLWSVGSMNGSPAQFDLPAKPKQEARPVTRLEDEIPF